MPLPKNREQEPQETVTKPPASPRPPANSESTNSADSLNQPFALPSVSLPRGGGAIRGIGEKFSVNAATGSGAFSIPVPFSPGRSGFTPSLALAYDSNGGNGPLGLGWGLQLPAITRKTDKGLPRYDDGGESDVFLLAGSEDLVPQLESTGARVSYPRTLFGTPYRVFFYRPRIEGLFSRIERWEAIPAARSFWRILSRDNVVTLYGYDPDSTIADPAQPDHIYSWRQCRSWDAKGNAAQYQYRPEDSSGIDLTQAHEANRTAKSRSAQTYLSSIVYGNKVPFFPDWTAAEEQPFPTEWLFQVVADYGDHTANPPNETGDVPWSLRPDPFSTYRSGFELRTYRRLQRLLFFHNIAGGQIANQAGDQPAGFTGLVRSLNLSYSDQATPPDPRSPVYTLLTSVTVTGYGENGATRTRPPLRFTYSQPVLGSTLQTLDADSFSNLPEGLDGTRYRLVDLDGEGLPGVLNDDGDGWYYKRNRSANNLVEQPDGSSSTRARFGLLETVERLPSHSSLSPVGGVLLNLAGDGRLDLVALADPDPGYFKRTSDATWEPFQSFTSLPQVDWNSPNLKFLDVTGDGLADVLITEDGLFTFYPSLGEDGFDAPATVRTPWDEEKGPKLVLADGTETIFIADMSGDGLNDIVRVRNGETCFWPNLGYGHFGAKVTMDAAPRFTSEDRFDPVRIRLADVDGSGTTDLLYVGPDGVRAWFNLSGNGWSAPAPIAVFPSADALSSVQVLDLLGSGTSCLVWSSPLPGATSAPLRYLDLMTAGKPHLLVNIQNSLGAETHLTYAPSTRFYREDADAGTPWVTRLAFPVQLVERVETIDWIGRNRLVTRYAYHHGYFDGYEREFRGFGRVEQWDTEEFRQDTAFPDGEFTNWDQASWSPPVHTVSWFHTGAFLNAGEVSRQFAGEYWAEPKLRAAGTDSAMLLPDTPLPPDLDPFEMQEAYRALKGRPLRVEVYAEDGSVLAANPYTVSETNFTLTCLQPRDLNLHAVFQVDPRETLSLQYERGSTHSSGDAVSFLADPRVTHQFVLETDTYGNVLRSASVAYGRRPGYALPEPTLAVSIQAALAYDQSRLHIRASANGYTVALDNPIAAPDAYRAPLSSQSDTAEFTGIAPAANISGVTNLFTFAEIDACFQQLWSGASDVSYENVPPSDVDGNGSPAAAPTRRLLGSQRTVYRADDLSALLPANELQSRALPGQTYRKAFTPGLLSGTLGALLDPSDLPATGYIQLSSDTGWWIPSNRLIFSSAGDPAAAELANALAHFFTPQSVLDPFGATTSVTYDPWDLLAVSATDAVGNLTTAAIDYRVLAAAMATDPNGNRTAAAFDALGLVTATAVMGKTTEALGDSLSGFTLDLAPADITAACAAPLAGPAALLGNATSRVLYDFDAYTRSGTPATAYTLARETHVSDLAPDETTRFQFSLAYSDGFARTVQTKSLAPPGPLNSTSDIVTTPRWIGSAWTVFNNKGKPVRQYEPFFSITPAFEFASQTGVCTTLLYDSLGRVVATLTPDNSWSKVVFDGWLQQAWDGNDTVLADPRTDPDIGPAFTRMLSSAAPGWHSWYDQRITGTYGSTAEQQAGQQDAATKTEAHAGTYASTYFDSLGRPVMAVADNGGGQRYASRTVLDTEGKPLLVLDPLGRRSEQYCVRSGPAYILGMDMAGRAIYSINADRGERRTLADITGAPARLWDARSHAFRLVYDAARRMTHRFVSTAGALEVLLNLFIYGEGQPQSNLCGRLFRQYDPAGFLENLAFDYKGNLLQGARQLAVDYHAAPDWTPLANLTTAATLDAAAQASGLIPSGDGGRDRFTSSTVYDALNRAIQTTTPHNPSMQPNVFQPGFDEARHIASLDVWLSQAAAPVALLAPATASFHAVTSIQYNARGQRLLLAHGNGATSTYTYDPETFRLTGLTATRPSSFPAAQQTVQQLAFFYDPSGNVTRNRDDADIQNVIFFRNQRVEPSSDYTYDPLYRILDASGREHLGQAGAAPQQVTEDDSSRIALPQPGDGNAMGLYTETYDFDPAGNLLSLVHATATGSWRCGFQYVEPSVIDLTETGNRLSATTLPGDIAGQYSAKYRYDAHGNMTSMPHLPSMAWDADDRLLSSTPQSVNDGSPRTTFYAYDASGMRVRKITDQAAVAGVKPVRASERIYLGPIEVYREFASGDGTTLALVRETLNVAAGDDTAVRVETRTLGNDPSPAQQLRYQYTNHLGSAVLELDEAAQVVSYEEYFPFGSTSYQAVASTTDVPERYRYTGKEHDEETGLYYHGARYYAPWLARWSAADPTGIADGDNLYRYSADNPIRFSDPTGTEGEDTNPRDGFHYESVTPKPGLIAPDFAYFRNRPTFLHWDVPPPPKDLSVEPPSVPETSGGDPQPVSPPTVYQSAAGQDPGKASVSLAVQASRFGLPSITAQANRGLTSFGDGWGIENVANVSGQVDGSGSYVSGTAGIGGHIFKSADSSQNNFGLYLLFTPQNFGAAPSGWTGGFTGTFAYERLFAKPGDKFNHDQPFFVLGVNASLAYQHANQLTAVGSPGSSVSTYLKNPVTGTVDVSGALNIGYYGDSKTPRLTLTAELFSTLGGSEDGLSTPGVSGLGGQSEAGGAGVAAGYNFRANNGRQIYTVGGNVGWRLQGDRVGPSETYLSYGVYGGVYAGVSWK